MNNYISYQRQNTEFNAYNRPQKNSEFWQSGQGKGK